MSPSLSGILSGVLVWTIALGVVIGNLATHVVLYLLRGVRWRMR